MRRLLFAPLLALPLFGAANLTISSAALAADGVTYNLTMSQSGLTASGIAGCFTLHGVSTLSGITSFVVNNGTGTASVVTFTTSLPAYAPDTVTLDIATVGGGCNLTGTSGANTPTGQSGVALTNASGWNAPGAALLSGLCRYTANAALGTQNGYPLAAKWVSGLGSMDCNATGSEIDALLLNYTSQWTVQQDGVTIACPSNCVAHNGADAGAQTTTATSGSVVYSVVQLATGLSGTHLYRIIPNFSQNGLAVVAAVRFVGGGATGTKPAATIPLVTMCGDSIAGVGGSGPTDGLQYDLGALAYNSTLGIVAQYSASSGALVSGALKDACGVNLILFSGNPAIGILQAGANDQNASVAQGTYTAAYETMICNALDYADCGDGSLNTTPPTKLLVRGILPNNYANSPAQYNGYTQSAIAAVKVLHPSAPIKYFSTDNWITAGTTGCPAHDTVDDVHPCGTLSLAGTGFGRVANMEAPILNGLLNGASYTFTCPATATVNIAVVCTLTLPAGATWTGSLEPVTLTDSGSSSFTGGATLTVPSSGTSIAVSFQPWATGTHTLTPASGAGAWTDASPVSITVSAQSPAPTFFIQ